MSLTPKNPRKEPLKSEAELNSFLQYAFSHEPNKESRFTVTIDSREYNLSDEQILQLGKEAGYSVERNGYDPLVINFS